MFYIAIFRTPSEQLLLWSFLYVMKFRNLLSSEDKALCKNWGTGTLRTAISYTNYSTIYSKTDWSLHFTFNHTPRWKTNFHTRTEHEGQEGE